jgi:hypothetical protein
MQSLLPWQPQKPLRKQLECIKRETDSYRRDQYFQRHPIVDAQYQRLHDQLLFEYGKQGLNTMKQVEREMDKQKVQLKHDEAPGDMQDAKVQQVMFRTHKPVDDREVHYCCVCTYIYKLEMEWSHEKRERHKGVLSIEMHVQ